jgi:hypothetical protein
VEGSFVETLASLHFTVTALSNSSRSSLNMRFSTVQAAAVAQLASTVFAHPHAAPAAEGSALHKRAVNIDAFKNKLGAAPAKYVTNEVIVEGKPKTPTRRAAAADADVAADQVKKLYPNAQFRQVSSYSSRNGVTHVYFKQTANGIDIDTADFNVNVSISTSFGSAWLTILSGQRWQGLLLR